MSKQTERQLAELDRHIAEKLAAQRKAAWLLYLRERDKRLGRTA